MITIEFGGFNLQLLPEKAIYIENLQTLLVADIHLGKSETFQASGIPIPSTVNQRTLDRLQQLCSQVKPKDLIILGDLFHSKFALVDEVVNVWQQFLTQISADVTLIIGNHDRRIIASLGKLAIRSCCDKIQIENLTLSHEPVSQKTGLNICGHIHPCVRLKSKLDTLRLPCFFLNKPKKLLLLPSFGEFTGGYDVPLKGSSIAYAIVENEIIPFAASK